MIFSLKLSLGNQFVSRPEINRTKNFIYRCLFFFFFLIFQDGETSSSHSDEDCIDPKEPSENKEQVLAL